MAAAFTSSVCPQVVTPLRSDTASSSQHPGLPSLLPLIPHSKKKKQTNKKTSKQQPTIIFPSLLQACVYLFIFKCYSFPTSVSVWYNLTDEIFHVFLEPSSICLCVISLTDGDAEGITSAYLGDFFLSTYLLYSRTRLSYFSNATRSLPVAN